MLILKPLFCSSKEAAEGNQMTMIVKKWAKKTNAVHRHAWANSVMPQIERNKLLALSDKSLPAPRILKKKNVGGR